MSAETVASVYAALANWLTYVGFLGLTGSVCGELVIKPLCVWQGSSPMVPWAIVSRRFLLVATSSAWLLVAASGVKLYAQTYAVFGFDEPVTARLMQLIAVESRWGGQWRPQFFAAVFAVPAVTLIRRVPRPGWWLSAIAVAALAVTLPMTGHAMAHAGGVALPWTLQAGHGLAAAAWVGTLTAIVLAATAFRAEPDRDAGIASLVHAFSPIAIAAVVSLMVTGTATAVLYLGGWSDLWTTSWGRALMLKVVLMLATGAVGAYNWRSLRPRLGTSAATGALLGSARRELLLASLVLVVTAILVHLPMGE